MIKVRLKFSKSGSMKFIGHLDVMRYFQKAVRRSEIDICYSQGFSPHQLMSFASPLGVGDTSDGEYLDMQLESMTLAEDLKDRLNEVMTEELKVLKVIALPEESKTSMSLLAAADYLVSVKDGYEFCEDFQSKFEAFLSQPQILIVKKTKRSEKEIDLKPFIYECRFDWNQEGSTAERYENGNRIFLKLTSGSVHNVKPELVMEAFCKYAGFAYNSFAYQIHRIEMYRDGNAKKGEVNPNGSGKERALIPLSE